MSLPTQLINIRLSKEFLPLVDEAARRQFINRSEFIRQAILEKLRHNNDKAFPNEHGLNILLTDEQFDEVWEIVREEKMR